MIITAWWLRTSSKFSGKKSKKQPQKLGNGELLSGCGFIQNIAPPSLSRDRRIKMEQTNKQTNIIRFGLPNLFSHDVINTKNFISGYSRVFLSTAILNE